MIDTLCSMKCSDDLTILVQCHSWLTLSTLPISSQRPVQPAEASYCHQDLAAMTPPSTSSSMQHCINIVGMVLIAITSRP